MHISLRISNGKLAGREIPVRVPRFLIGCAEDCHLKIPATQVSLYHCALLVQDDGIWVRNYGTGVNVGGVRIVDRRRLNDGDEVQVGLVRFEMHIEGAPAKRERVPQEAKSPDSPKPVESSVTPLLEPSDLSNAPTVSSEANAEPATEEEDADEVRRRREEELDPASEVATDTLLRFYTCRNDHGGQKVAAAPVVAPVRTKPSWWMLVNADGGLNPNVMFVLGILVGIGLSTAANTFWMISGQPADTDSASTMVDPGSLVTTELGTTEEEEEPLAEE